VEPLPKPVNGSTEAHEIDVSNSHIKPRKVPTRKIETVGPRMLVGPEAWIDPRPDTPVRHYSLSAFCKPPTALGILTFGPTHHRPQQDASPPDDAEIACCYSDLSVSFTYRPDFHRAGGFVALRPGAVIDLDQCKGRQ